MISEGILQDVKNYLNITWTDETTDQKISGLIASGIFYIDDKAGKAQDYQVSGYPRTLLLEYVRYARDEALDVFENNYCSFILAMQNNRKVGEYVQKTEPTDT